MACVSFTASYWRVREHHAVHEVDDAGLVRRLIQRAAAP
jgi:hypothetical protein